MSCYLAAISCLHLAEAKYAWIVKPAISSNASEGTVDSKNPSKRKSDGCAVLHSSRPIKVEVIGIPDIRREYSLVQARLLYVKKCGISSNLVITPLTAEETVALLLNGCLFEAAINLSKSFNLSLVPVFETLTYRCLSSSLKSEVFTSNDFEKSVLLKSNCVGTELSTNACIWNNLKNYLFEYELPGESELHRCVTEKLLAHGAAIPAWLKLSYQKRNFTELLYLYITYGLLEESVVLLNKYVKAILGERKEDFSLKFSLHGASPAVWLPHTYIDIILDCINDIKTEHNKDICEEFTATLEKYYNTVESVSADKLSKSVTFLQH